MTPAVPRRGDPRGRLLRCPHRPRRIRRTARRHSENPWFPEVRRLLERSIGGEFPSLNICLGGAMLPPSPVVHHHSAGAPADRDLRTCGHLGGEIGPRVRVTVRSRLPAVLFLQEEMALPDGAGTHRHRIGRPGPSLPPRRIRLGARSSTRRPMPVRSPAGSTETIWRAAGREDRGFDHRRGRRPRRGTQKDRPGPGAFVRRVPRR